MQEIDAVGKMNATMQADRRAWNELALVEAEARARLETDTVKGEKYSATVRAAMEAEVRHKLAYLCPGQTVREMMSDRGWTVGGLATRSGIRLARLKQLMNGEIELKMFDAQALERAFRVPASFWLNLEKLYRHHVRKALDEKLGGERS